MKKVIGCVLSMLLTVGSCMALTWTEEVLYSMINTGGLDRESVVMDSSENFHLAFGSDTIYYGFYDGEMSYINLDYGSGGHGYYSIQLDSLGYPHIVCNNFTTLKHYYQDASGWHYEEILTANGLGGPCSMKIDSSDCLHIAYERNDGDMHYVENTSGSWVDTQIGSGFGNQRPLLYLQLDTDDEPHFFTHRSYSSNVCFPYYIYHDGNNWIEEMIYGDGAYKGGACAISPEGQPIVVFKEFGPNLLYCTRTETGWTFETILSNSSVMLHLNIDFDSQGFPHVVSSDWNNNEVIYSTKGTGGWTSETLYWGYHPPELGFALDAQDKAHIIYGDGDFYHETNQTGFWSQSQILGGTGISVANMDRIYTGANQSVFSFGCCYNAGITFAEFDGTSFSTTPIPGSIQADPYGTSMTPNNLGYYSIAGNFYSHESFYMFEFDGSNWIENYISGEESNSEMYDLIQSSSGDYHFIWSPFGSLNHLYRLNGTDNWIYGFEAITSNNGVTAILVEDVNNDIITVNCVDSDVQVGRFTNYTWTWETIDTDLPGSSSGSTTHNLILDSVGHIHVIYDLAVKNEFRHAVKTEGSWAIETVQSPSDIYANSRFETVIDDAGNISIFYRDQNNELARGFNESGSWQKEVVSEYEFTHIEAAIKENGNFDLFVLGTIDRNLVHIVSSPNPPCLHHGDVDGDGEITTADAQQAFYIILGLVSPTYEEECAADCNGSGSVTANDAQLIFLNVMGSGNCVDPL